MIRMRVSGFALILAAAIGGAAAARDATKPDSPTQAAPKLNAAKAVSLAPVVLQEPPHHDVQIRHAAIEAQAAACAGRVSLL
jgi:hypothetical protein